MFKCFCGFSAIESSVGLAKLTLHLCNLQINEPTKVSSSVHREEQTF